MPCPVKDRVVQSRDGRQYHLNNFVRIPRYFLSYPYECLNTVRGGGVSTDLLSCLISRSSRPSPSLSLSFFLFRPTRRRRRRQRDHLASSSTSWFETVSRQSLFKIPAKTEGISMLPYLLLQIPLSELGSWFLLLQQPLAFPCQSDIKRPDSVLRCLCVRPSKEFGCRRENRYRTLRQSDRATEHRRERERPRLRSLRSR